MADYDYIIVGGGSAGCVLANRLSADPDVSVLLLEAGGSGRSLFIRMPAANGFVFGRPEFDWAYRSVPQPELGGRCIYYPRGRGLGGSSGINGMIYIRGNPRDYDGWRQLGLEAWGYADVLPYFRRSEGSAYRKDEFHDSDGPLRTRAPANMTVLDRAFLAAAQEAGLPINSDFNGASQLGAGMVDVTVDGGERCSAEAAYLAPVRQRPNLSVRTGALAEALLWEGSRVRGVRYTGREGRQEVMATREVVLSLGAFGSPQLLMLSGLGPAEELRRHGIPVVAELPGVGQNLQDHPNIPIQFACSDEDMTLARYQRIDRAIWLGLRYLLTRRGPGAAPFWSTCAFQALEDGSAVPDLQYFFTPMLVVEDPEDERSQRQVKFRRQLGAAMLTRDKHAAAGFQIDANLLHPLGRGQLKLRSPDCRDHPLIDPAYLVEEKDRQDAVAAIRRVREIVGQPAFARLRGEEISPGPAARSDEDLLTAARRIMTTGHHPVGTCKMGRAEDPLAVVDQELKVRGVEGLRVVDASVMPAVTTGNTNAPVMMIAEKAADMILGCPPPARIDPRTP